MSISCSPKNRDYEGRYVADLAAEADKTSASSVEPSSYDWVFDVLLDPDTVADRATYEAPHQYPLGIPHVIVNGRLVIHHGHHVQERPGSILGQ
jgi:hypothetical protein